MKIDRMSAACGIALVAMTGCTGMPTTHVPKMDARAEIIATNLSPAERSAFERLYHEGERNAVLNFEELGVAALEAGQFERAEVAFGEAIARIERVYANDENARKAKSVWAEEKVKDFKGEPYERAMAYFYRGLLYARAGDFQNARASFLTAEFQDTVAEKEQFQGDFALMSYLAAWASYCDRDDDKSREFLDRAVKADASLAPLTASRRALLVLEGGQGPLKHAGGKQGELLQFQERPASSDVPGDIDGIGRGSPWLKAADVVYQATTRGGRPIQAVLDGKVQWKEGTDAAGTAMIAAGATAMMAGSLTNNDAMAQFGGYASLLGSFISLASSAMQTRADTRHWVGLPHDVFVQELDVDIAGTKAGFVTNFTGADGVVQSTTLAPLATHERCAIAWGRTRKGSLLSAHRAIEPARGKRDDVFRVDIVEKFEAKGSRI